jgi:hypothetical protein
VLRTMRRRNTMYAVGHSMYRWLVIDHTPNVFEEAMGLSGIKFPLPPGCYSVDVSSSVSAHHASTYLHTPDVFHAITGGSIRDFHETCTSPSFPARSSKTKKPMLGKLFTKSHSM